MKSFIRILAVTIALLITAHRLPAPIQEVPESPTPTPEQSSKPRAKKAKSTGESSADKRLTASPTPSAKQGKRFAGTWVGTMATIPWGNWAVVLVVDANEATVSEQINGEKAMVRPATRSGEMLQARFPAGLTSITWSLTPLADGATANVRFEAFMNDQTAVFHRTTK